MLSTATLLAAGDRHSLAVRSDATVAAWGSNSSGQLGDGTTTSRSAPVSVSGISNVAGVAGGTSHSVAVKQDGTLWTWGNNASGQLRTGTTTNQTTPVQVSGMNGYIAVAAGDAFSAALKSDGSVWTWGSNSDGQLGDGTTINRLSPAQVKGVGGTGTLSGIVAIAAGRFHMLALSATGTVYVWGRNAEGELGTGNTTSSSTPVLVSGLTSVRSLAGGRYTSLVAKQDGSVWNWGGDLFGQLADGAANGPQTSPKQASGVTAMTNVAATADSSAALGVSRAAATITYTYDNLYRLKTAVDRGLTTTYTYDPVGNRTKRTRVAVDTTYNYDRADHILNTQVAGAVPTTYTVNANGNETARGADTFSYDQANRLTSVGLAGVQTFQYGFDGDGKRVSSSILGVVGTSNFTYDVAGSLPLLLDDGSRKFVWGLGELYNVDKTTGAAQVYHTDGLGSVRAITDTTSPNALVIQTYRTDEFGIPDPSGTMGASTQSLQYTGEQRDAESNFMYLRARMYDPSIGRFMQTDPQGISSCDQSQPHQLNRFSYADDNPIIRTDRSGRSSNLVMSEASILSPAPQLVYFRFADLADTDLTDTDLTDTDPSQGCTLRIVVWTWTPESGLTQTPVCLSIPDITGARRGTVECTAKGYWYDIAQATYEGPYTATARGSDPVATCAAAETAFRNSTPIGFRARHVQCDPQRDCRRI